MTTIEQDITLIQFESPNIGLDSGSDDGSDDESDTWSDVDTDEDSDYEDYLIDTQLATANLAITPQELAPTQDIEPICLPEYSSYR